MEPKPGTPTPKPRIANWKRKANLRTPGPRPKSQDSKPRPYTRTQAQDPDFKLQKYNPKPKPQTQKQAGANGCPDWHCPLPCGQVYSWQALAVGAWQTSQVACTLPRAHQGAQATVATCVREWGVAVPWAPEPEAGRHRVRLPHAPAQPQAPQAARPAPARLSWPTAPGLGHRPTLPGGVENAAWARPRALEVGQMLPCGRSQDPVLAATHPPGTCVCVH